MNDAERALRGEIIRTCLAMEARGINQGTSGNVSARWNDGLLITPSGLAYATMAPEDIIFLTMDGTAHGPHAPSSEWRFHLDIMRERTDVDAIVHAHPPYLTGLSMLNKDIPAVHYMIAAVGGPSVRCAPYATYGTEELSRNALAALDGRMGCILANHGVIACGPDLGKALWLAREMETLAQQYTIAVSVGTPVVLSDEEIANVIEKFKSYGPKRKDEGALKAAAPTAEPAPTPAPETTPEPAPKAAAAKPATRRAASKKPAPAATAKAPKPAAKPAPRKPAAKAAAAAETAVAATPAPTLAKKAPARAAKATKAAAAPAATQSADEPAEAAPAKGSKAAPKVARKKPLARPARANSKTAG